MPSTEISKFYNENRSSVALLLSTIQHLFKEKDAQVSAAAILCSMITCAVWKDSQRNALLALHQRIQECLSDLSPSMETMITQEQVNKILDDAGIGPAAAAERELLHKMFFTREEKP